MTTNPFATTIVDTLFDSTANTGTNLMGTAMRLATSAMASKLSGSTGSS